MADKKLAIVLCIHHKPWLVMSTLITLALQDYRDFDLYLLYQSGDGSCRDKKSYEEYFRVADRLGGFLQLSMDDSRVIKIAHEVNFGKVYDMEFENDHSLDSGAWYKFIKSGNWRKYDYLFFIQEGNLFTGQKVISSVLEFAASNNAQFLSSGHEKRRWPKDIFLKCNRRHLNYSEIDVFHDHKLQEVFEVFCRDDSFRHLYEQWGSGFAVTTQNCVPFKGILNERLFHWYQLARAGMIKGLLGAEILLENGKLRYLSEISDSYFKHGEVVFHRDNGLEWFGCSCQHLFTRKLIEDFSGKIEKYGIYDVLDIPFSAGALEIVWGFIPIWLGYDKWFFNGFHRVRKNFLTYEREDDQAGMCRYINKYFWPIIQIVPDGDFVKIRALSGKHSYLKKILGKDYFV